MDPLVTRAMPGSPWEKVPTSVSSIDIQVSQNFEDLFLHYPQFLKGLKFATEEPWFLGLQFLILALVALYFRHKRLRAQRAPKGIFSQNFFLFFIFVCLSLAISDFLASFLKNEIGRLKPHVDFYHPSARPALSFPSNHAFNSAALVGLLFFRFQKYRTLVFYRKEISLAFIWVFVLGLSRVALGQHHFLDIFAGWLLGFGWSYLASLGFFRLIGAQKKLNGNNS